MKYAPLLRLSPALLCCLALLGCDDGSSAAPGDDPDARFLSDDGKADGPWSECALDNVLRLVNGPDLSVRALTDGGVNTTAAKRIVAARAGGDGVLGTEDDASFGDLPALDAIWGVGRVTLGQLADLGGATCAVAPTYEVLLTDPICDECEPADKAWLVAHSRIAQRVVELIDGAKDRVDVAQFTFSVRPIEAALKAAHARGVKVRLAIDSGQKNGDSVAKRLEAAGVAVTYVKGQDAGSYTGLQHAKFMLVDEGTLLTGSNNWSSTGTSINEENTIVVHTTATDPLFAGFRCHFEAMWAQNPGAAGRCSIDDVVGFTPGSQPIGMLVDALRAADTSVDVLMHHLVFDKLLKVLAQTAERGVRVRVVVNAADLDETRGALWDRLRAAGGEVRYKRSNGDLYQLMHNKLAIVDGDELLNGSGNWSGSAFFNNYENYVRYTQPEVVRPFEELFQRLWDWSLDEGGLASGITPARQHAETHRAWFGNLHAHFHAHDGSWDDGKAERKDEAGEAYAVAVGETPAEAAKHAFEYARDLGQLDFLALTPHAAGDDPNYTGPNMRPEGFAALLAVADEVTARSNDFVALPGVEWSSNSSGNHINIFGTDVLTTVKWGEFDRLYDGFLPERVAAGEAPRIMFNHPRTFQSNEDFINGSWDQIFVPLSEIPNNGERTKKFNDYGLDDYPPLADVRQSWIDGEVTPDRAVVAATLRNVAAASAPYLRLMEVTVGRGTDLGSETPQNPSLSVDEDGNMSRYTKVHTDWDYYLLNGFRTAPAANHDNHYANWGTGHTTRTAVLAPVMTEASLMGAIDQRLVYATEAPALDLRFYALDRVPMGGETRTLAARATGEFMFADPDYAGPYTVQLMRGRVGDEAVEAVQAFDAVTAANWQAVALDLPQAGTYFFYLEVHQLDVDRMAWSAPIWIERVE